ncbi:MAG: histidine phosphatase family protein [Candidatus Thorarchaeota archaeon]
MSSTFLFLRHAETEIESKRHVTLWDLTENGLEQTRILVETGVFDGIDFIIASKESKAIKTAEPIADRLGVLITSSPAFNELDRGNNYLSLEQYQSNVKAVFENFNSSVSGWELAADALERFEKGILSLEDKYDSKKILIVSHGLVLTLYFGSIIGEMDHCFQRWSKLKFLAYGVVEDRRVIRDIA